MDESIRVFCAVELPEEVRAAAAAQAARLRRDFPDARAGWARPEGLHVTLKFIGEVEAARVLWLGVKDSAGQLSRLQRRLEEECEAAGFPREPRAFKPHLTLARLRTPKDAHALSEAHRQTPFGPYRFEADELVVMRSELGPGGSRYTPLSHHSFNV